MKPHLKLPAETPLQARRRSDMVQDQLVGRGIKNPRVMEAMGLVPRHLFVEEALGERAYEDGPLPIGEGQTISQPYMVALMLEALELKGDERVLEIGAGCGYAAVLLSLLAGQVYCIERKSALAANAGQRVNQMERYNVRVRSGDGSRGWKTESPFDAILVSAGAPAAPEALKDQLAEGGRLAIPIGPENSQQLYRFQREGDRLHSEILCNCRFVKLIGAQGWSQ